MQFRVIVVTDPQTHKHRNPHTQTHRQDRLQYTAPQLARSVMKQRSEETQTLCAGCRLVRPAADPLLGGAGHPKCNQPEMITTFTYRPSLVKIDERNFELSW